MPRAVRSNKKLSAKQLQTLRFIKSHFAEKGYAPSIADISAHLGQKSNGTADECLQALERKGFIERIPRVARGLRLLKSPTKKGVTET